VIEEENKETRYKQRTPDADIVSCMHALTVPVKSGACTELYCTTTALLCRIYAMMRRNDDGFHHPEMLLATEDRDVPILPHSRCLFFESCPSSYGIYTFQRTLISHNLTYQLGLSLSSMAHIHRPTWFMLIGSNACETADVSLFYEMQRDGRVMAIKNRDIN
jgi:hypothetical protein